MNCRERDRGDAVELPTTDVVRAWMRNHVCTPRDGIPAWFAAGLTAEADGKGTNGNRKENKNGEC